MPSEMSQSPPMHEPSQSNVRPKGILKNPSFSGQGGQHSPTREVAPTPPSVPFDPQDAKELTLQNTLQNAGHRRSSSAARRSSASRRHSSAAGLTAGENDSEAQRLKWDEANLYLAEQEAGGRMKITEPKTPFEYGNNAMDEDEEEDVSIDPRFVNVDEVEMAKKKQNKKSRESDIPDMDLGEPEDENAGASVEDDRILRQGSMSRESSKEKHVIVDNEQDLPGLPTQEEKEKHQKFEAQRRKHYEMRNVKDMLGHPDSLNDEDDEDTPMGNPLPNRGVNGGP